ncbi:MAG: YkgJ family cysteine cluster protein [Nanoarchaeota archaeon]
MFECQRCCFCCQLDVVVDEQDIKRLKRAGKKNFTITREGKKFLKHKGNFCIFFKDGLCSVYPVRPSVCQRFPFERDGTFSEKCKQRKDFGSRVERRMVEFLIRDEAKRDDSFKNNS